MTPGGIEFGRDSKYDEPVRVYQEVIAALPKIDGWRPEDIPMDLDEIAQKGGSSKIDGWVNADTVTTGDKPWNTVRMVVPRPEANSFFPT